MLSCSHIWWEAAPSQPSCSKQYRLRPSFSKETVPQPALWKPLQRWAHNPAQQWLLPVRRYSTQKCLQNGGSTTSFELNLSLILPLAETSMTEDYHLDQSDGKRYSLDPGDSAFGSISSSYSTKSYSFRSTQQFSNGPASMSMCRQSSTSPNSFPESNRTGGNV